RSPWAGRPPRRTSPHCSSSSPARTPRTSPAPPRTSTAAPTSPDGSTEGGNIMNSATNVVKKILDALEKVVMLAAVASLAVIVLTVVWQVIARYVTSQSTAWAPELAQTAFVWTALLAIPLGTRSGRHMLVDRSEEHTSELQSRFDLVCR